MTARRGRLAKGQDLSARLSEEKRYGHSEKKFVVDGQMTIVRIRVIRDKTFVLTSFHSISKSWVTTERRILPRPSIFCQVCRRHNRTFHSDAISRYRYQEAFPDAVCVHKQALASTSSEYLCDARCTESTGPSRLLEYIVDTSRNRHVCGSFQLALQRDAVRSSSLDVHLHGMA